MVSGSLTPTEAERKYILDRVAEILASQYYGELDLLYPEMAAALCKCDVRTLESKGLPRVELGPRNIRYRRSDVMALIEKFYAPSTRKTNQHESPALPTG